MSDLIARALRSDPGTCLILTGYVMNVVQYLVRGYWGPAWYWAAAAQITFVATWLMQWGRR